MSAPRIVQEPAEGSREVVERELRRQTRRRESRPSPAATSDDIKRILGDIEEHKIVEILALRPRVADVEQAALWKAGQDDVVGRPTLKGRAAAIYDIFSVDEEEDEGPLKSERQG